MRAVSMTAVATDAQLLERIGGEAPQLAHSLATKGLLAFDEQRKVWGFTKLAHTPGIIKLREGTAFKPTKPEGVRDTAGSRIWWLLGPELMVEVTPLAHEGTPRLNIYTRAPGPDSLRVGQWEKHGPYQVFPTHGGEQYAIGYLKKETPKSSLTWLSSHCISQRQEVERFIASSAIIRKELGLREPEPTEEVEEPAQEDKAFPTLKSGVSTRVETDVAEELGITGSTAQATAAAPRGSGYPVEPTIAQDKASAAVAKLLGDGKWHDFFEVWEASGGHFYQVTVRHNADYPPRDWQVRIVSRWDGPGKSFITHASSAAALTYLEQKKEAAR